MRVGMGYDVHRLTEERPLILGGVEIPYDKGLLGHSDADVLLHAIMDALLGAAALGDIGKHFPDTDPAYKGISSIRLLEHVGALLEERDALDIINGEMIPALDVVGKGFEQGTVFLPQLLMSAEAAKAAFEVIKDRMAQSGESREKKGIIILATVKGDIHDIGKNIVKVLLENYSYQVVDLGKDVPPEKIVKEAVERKVPLVGLSALMTTTVPSMEETIVRLRKQAPWVKVMVGGAVLTEEYARTIGADRYCRDAMASVNYAESLFMERELPENEKGAGER